MTQIDEKSLTSGNSFLVGKRARSADFLEHPYVNGVGEHISALIRYYEHL
jgi:hypothetical protein